MLLASASALYASSLRPVTTVRVRRVECICYEGCSYSCFMTYFYIFSCVYQVVRRSSVSPRTSPPHVLHTTPLLISNQIYREFCLGDSVCGGILLPLICSSPLVECVIGWLKKSGSRVELLRGAGLGFVVRYGYIYICYLRLLVNFIKRQQM